MPKFAYVAVNTEGSTVEGAVKKSTIGEVRSFLKDASLFPVKITEQRRRLLDFEVTTEKLKKRELMHFSSQLAVFIKAGIPIIDSLETIADEAHDKVLRKVIADMVERLRGGQTFSDAASAHPEAFPGYYTGVLKSAELTGKLDETVDDLAGYLDREITARQKVVAALVYPSIVMAMALVTIAILAIVVLPQFKKLFAEFDTELPLSTRMLLGMTRFVTDMWYVPVLLIMSVIVAVGWMMKTDRGRRARDTLVPKLPVVGDIMRYSMLERFTRILGAMVTAGVPLPEAMETTNQSVGNVIYRERLEAARTEMLRGNGLARPLIDTGIFPGAARQMMTVGEETGTLDNQLANASSYFDRELDVKIRRFTSLFEPVTIIFVGVCVGFVAVAMVQAMYGVLGGIK